MLEDLLDEYYNLSIVSNHSITTNWDIIEVLNPNKLRLNVVGGCFGILDMKDIVKYYGRQKQRAFLVKINERFFKLFIC